MAVVIKSPRHTQTVKGMTPKFCDVSQNIIERRFSLFLVDYKVSSRDQRPNVPERNQFDGQLFSH